MASIAALKEDGKWVCHPQSPHYGIWIKLLILFEPKLQRAVNYTWKIVWARPLADGKTMVANEISRLPHGKSFYAFPLWCFESLHGESMPEPSLGRFSIMNKTTIKKTNKFNNDNLFAFCRLKRQISFSPKYPSLSTSNRQTATRGIDQRLYHHKLTRVFIETVGCQC